MNKQRLVKIEEQAAARGSVSHTWPQFIAGEWTPAPEEWAAFVAAQKPSDIAAYCDGLIARGVFATEEQRRALDAMRQSHE